MDKNQVASLDNGTLARLLLRTVWQGYDAGGISAGRSLRAFLLESAMEFLPVAGLDFGPEDYALVLEEAERRVTAGHPPVQLILFPGRGRITGLLDSQFVQLLLAEIQRWYRQQRNEPGFYLRDVKLIFLAQRLLPHNLKLNKYSREAVDSEAKERLWIRRQRSLEEWDRQRRERDEGILQGINEQED